MNLKDEMIKMPEEKLINFFASMFMIIHKKLLEYGIQSTFIKEIMKEIRDAVIKELGFDVKDFEETYEPKR